MAGTNSFLQVDTNQSNFMTDTEFAEAAETTDGVQIGVAADPNWHNKLFYQTTTMTHSLAQVFANLGYDMNDSSVSTLVTTLSTLLTTDYVWSSFTGDFEAETTKGFYVSSAIGQTNAPTPSEKFFLVVGVAGTSIYQLALGATTGSIFYNVYNGTSWIGWSQLSNDAVNVESTGYGIISGGKVSAQSTANMTVTVASGVAHMPSGKRYPISAVASQAIAAADATKPRIDLIYVNSSGVNTYLEGDLGTAAVAGARTYTVTTNFMAAIAGTRDYTLTTNFVSGDTVVFDGKTFTATTATQDTADFVVGSTITASMTNLATALNANTTVAATYIATESSGVITVTEITAGGGNTPGTMTVTGAGVISAGTATTSTAADTLTVDGITFTATASTTSSTKFAVSSTIAATVANIAIALGDNATVTGTYTVTSSGATFTLTETTAGGGNTPAAATCSGTGVVTSGTAITSTAAIWAAAPTLPTGALSLAEIAVSANITTITSSNITDTRTIKVNLQSLTDYTGTAKVADIISKGPKVDVRAFGATGDGSTDDTAAIQLAFNSVATGEMLLFPPGTYLHTGLTLSKRINIVGSGNLSTILKNIGTGDAITISSGIMYGSFRDITIRGNGTTNYGADATSGNGIVFSNNAVMWDFCNVSVYYHGGFGFYACGNGNVNNIYIRNCQIEHCLNGGIRFIQTNSSNQINAIYIDKCNIAGHGGNAVELWGQSIVVQNNTIQSNKGYGVIVDAEIEPNGDGTTCFASSISIKDNYFEKCNLGFIYARAYYISSTYVRYISGLTIEDNYGNFSKISGDTVSGTVSCVEVAAPLWYSYDNYQIAGFKYAGNSFSYTDTATYILNCNNVLSWDSVVEVNAVSTAVTSSSLYVNLGRAKTGFTNLNIPVRNTVISGPVDSSGLPANLSAVSGSLAISELSGSMTTWANGFDANGQVDYIQLLTADVSSAWSSLTASSTLYLYKRHGTTKNTITYEFTTIKPIYQDYAPTTTTNNTWYFNTKTMIGYAYSSSSSAWSVSPRVYIGECVTGTSLVTSVTCYAYQGKYKSQAYTTPATATAVSESHNIGMMPRIVQARLQCITTDLGHTVDDEIGSYASYDGTYMLPIAPTVNRLTIGVTTGSSGLYGINKSTGVGASLTLADWGYVFEAERGW